MSVPADLLAAYDEELRTTAETGGATAVTRRGPLHLATFPGGRGLVTYRDLAGGDVGQLVGVALDHFRSDPSVVCVEWKTRGHDRAPGLHRSLVDHGFAPDEPESVMVGPARSLTVDIALPAGVTVRRVTDEPSVRAAGALAGEVFDDPVPGARADDLIRRLSSGDGLQLWVAECGGRVVSTGRLELVAGTGFAGLWGGATHPGWRGRGIYRALTAARARAALELGAHLLTSDSTEHSRPILERAGLVRITTTTPYLWHR